MEEVELFNKTKAKTGNCGRTLFIATNNIRRYIVMVKPKERVTMS